MSYEYMRLLQTETEQREEARLLRMGKKAGWMGLTADASGNDNPYITTEVVEKAERRPQAFDTPIQIYVASRATPAHAAMWRYYRDHDSVPINSSWIDQVDEGASNYGTLWPAIVEQIRACAALVLFAGHNDFPLKGAFVEVGMALAFNKPVYCVLPGVTLEERTFRPVGSWMNHPLVKQVILPGEAFMEIMK